MTGARELPRDIVWESLVAFDEPGVRFGEDSE